MAGSHASLRAVLALLVSTLLAVGLFPGPAAARPPQRTLSVLSYNIHHGVGGDGRLDLDRIAAVIRDSGADVAALQEVDRHWSARSGLADQAKELARRLRMHHAYGANLDRAPAEPGQPRRQYGTAILSRFPILSSRNTPLPNTGGEQRGLLGARINVRGRRALVYSTHLQHDNAEERRLQAEAIVEEIGSRTEPVVLAGDLNARPDAPELAAVRESFTDTFEVAGVGDGATYPAPAPTARIDYVLTNDHVGSVRADVIATQASDHLPVRAELVLTAPYANVAALDRAHAHNDYEHRRPLFDALHHGFTSVEADIWLVDGELCVAHDLVDTDPCRTLSELYLDPLRTIVQANRGRVYPGRSAPVQLLVDVKSEAEPTYRALSKELRPHRRMLTRFGPHGTAPSAVEVVVSGKRPRSLMASEPVRWAAYDGRLSDLRGGAPADFIPLISLAEGG